MDELSTTVGIILALSIASERLVEIIKGYIPWLDHKRVNVKEEGKRRSAVQILAVVSGIVTAFMAKDYLPVVVVEQTNVLNIIGLGLLASGGSGFWNSILTYVTKVKDIKTLEFESKAAGNSGY